MTVNAELLAEAYVDGELDAELASAFEQQLQRDPALRTRVSRLRETAALLRGAFNQPLHESVPPGLLAPFDDGPAVRGWDDGHRRSRSVVSRYSWQALAAAVVLGIGLGSGFKIFEWSAAERVRVAEQQKLLALDAATRTVNEALENKLSGTQARWMSPDGQYAVTVTPLRTYKTREGRYCREYRQELVQGEVREVSRGLSCRGSGPVWEPPVRLGGERLKSM